MNTNTLAAAVIGFLLGGLVVSIAAELEGNSPEPATHGSSSIGAQVSEAALLSMPDPSRR